MAVWKRTDEEKIDWSSENIAVASCPIPRTDHNRKYKMDCGRSFTVSMERKVRILSLEFLWILSGDREFRTSPAFGNADSTSCRRVRVRQFYVETAVSEFIAIPGRISQPKLNIIIRYLYINIVIGYPERCVMSCWHHRIIRL